MAEDSRRTPSTGQSHRRIKAGSHITMPCIPGRSSRFNTDARDTISNRFEERNVIQSSWSSTETDPDKTEKKEDPSVQEDQRGAAVDIRLVWFKDGKPVQLEGSRSQDPTNMALTVRHATKNDSGTYTCAYVTTSSDETTTAGNAIQLIVEGE